MQLSLGRYTIAAKFSKKFFGRTVAYATRLGAQTGKVSTVVEIGKEQSIFEVMYYMTFMWFGVSLTRFQSDKYLVFLEELSKLTVINNSVQKTEQAPCKDQQVAKVLNLLDKLKTNQIDNRRSPS